MVVVPQTRQNERWEKGEKCRQVGTIVNHAKRSTVTIQSVLGDKLETSVKSCGQRTQSVAGDNWESRAKSCAPERAEHPECTGR